MSVGKFEKILFFFVLGTLLSCGNTENVGRILRAICVVHDPSTIQNISCWARPINRSVSLVNMECNITKIMRDVKLNIQVYKRTDLVFRPFIINVTEDYCRFFEKNKGGFYMTLLTRIYLPYTNMNHKCPYFGHVYIKDLPLHSNNIPPLWPPGEYRMDVLVIGGASNLVTVQLFIEIRNKPEVW